MKIPYMQVTEERFNHYPSVSKAQQIENDIEGISIDYGHSASRGGVHENLLNESEQERLSNPY